MPDQVKKAPRIAELRAELEAERDRLQPVLDAAREVNDRLSNHPELLEARRVIKETSAKLIPVLNELAALARPAAKASLKAEPGVYDGSGR